MGKSLLPKLTAKKPKSYKQYNSATQSVYQKGDGGRGRKKAQRRSK